MLSEISGFQTFYILRTLTRAPNTLTRLLTIRERVGETGREGRGEGEGRERMNENESFREVEGVGPCHKPPLRFE